MSESRRPDNLEKALVKTKGKLAQSLMLSVLPAAHDSDHQGETYLPRYPTALSPRAWEQQSRFIGGHHLLA